MAQKKNEDETTTSDIPLVDEWVADNYDALVADENRGLSYKDVAANADAQGDKALAAWARGRAAGKGKDVTPTQAEKAPETVTRSEVQDDGSRKDVQVPTVTPEDSAAAAAPVQPKSDK